MDVSELKLKFSATGVESTRRDVRSLDDSVLNMADHANRAGSRLSNMFATAGRFVLGGVINAISGSIAQMGAGILMASANAEQAKISLEVVTGSAEKAQALFEGLQKFAASTPFSFPELERAAISLEAFGMKTMDWLPTIGDTAAAMGKSVDQVVQAILDASTGEYERLKELGIKASVVGDQVKLRYLKNGKEIVEMVDKNNQELINSTIMSIWNEKYDGAMKKQSRTFIGQWSTLKDNINIALMEMTGGIFEFAKGGIAFANVFLNRISRLRSKGLSPMQVVLKAIRIQIYKTFGRGTLNVVNAIAHAIVWGFGKARDAIASVTDFIGKWVKVMGWAFSSGLKVSSLVYAFPAPLRAVARGFLLIADAVGDAFHAFQSGGFSGLLKQLPDTLSQIWDGLKNIGGAAINFVIDGAVSIGSALLGIAADFGGWLWTQIKGSWDDVLRIGSAAIDGAISLAGDLWTAAQNFGAWLWGKIKGNWDNVLKIGVATITATIALAADTDWSTIGTAVKNGVVGAISKLVTLGADIGGAVLEKIKGIDWATVVTGDSFNVGVAFGAALRSAIGKAIEIGAGIVGGLVDAIAGLTWDDVITAIKVALGVALAVPGVLAAVGVAIASAIGGAIAGFVFGPDVDFGDVVGKIRDAITGLIDKGHDKALAIKDSIIAWLESAITPDMFSETAASIGTWLWNAITDFIIDKAPSALGIKDKLKEVLGKSDEQGPAVGGGEINQFASPAVIDSLNNLKAGLDNIDFGARIKDLADTKTGSSDLGKEFSVLSRIVDASSRVIASGFTQIATIARARFMDVQNAARQCADRTIAALSVLPARMAQLGLLAGLSLAGGLMAALPSVIAAALAIAAAVDIAVAARLKIASPSKIMLEHGRNTVNPFLDQLRFGAGEAGRLFGGMGLPSAGRAGFTAAYPIGAGNTYIFTGNIIGADIDRFIEAKIASGQAKRIDRRVSSRALQESS